MHKSDSSNSSKGPPLRLNSRRQSGQAMTEFILLMSGLTLVGCFLLSKLTASALDQARKNNLAPILDNAVEDAFLHK